MTDIETILYKLGSIETNMAEVRNCISGLPCAVQAEKITRLEQQNVNNADNKSNKFKLNAQILSIIAITISTLVAISSLYANFIK